MGVRLNPNRDRLEMVIRIRECLKASWPLFFLIILNWVIRYWYSGQFGFYEDDHHFVLRAIEMKGSEVWDFLFNLEDIFQFLGAGHPLHPRAITVLSKLGWELGKLQGLYWLSFFIGADQHRTFLPSHETSAQC